MKVQPYTVVYDVNQIRGQARIVRKRSCTKWEAIRYLSRMMAKGEYEVRGSFWSSRALEWRFTEWISGLTFIEDPTQFSIDNGQYK